MPKDQRLYMTFPNDFHRHPKVSRLSVEARWAFVEMNGEARLADNDGVFSAEDAEFMWSPDVLAALCGSHPTRPLIARDGDTYVIRDYAEHQQTKAEREALSEARSKAGALGAAAKAERQAGAKQVPSKRQQVPSKVQQTQAEIETELEITSSKELVARKRASTVPKTFSITPDMREWAREHAPLVDLDTVLPEFIDYWTGTGKAMKDWVSVWRNGMRKQQQFAERDAAKRPAALKVSKNDEWMYR